MSRLEHIVQNKWSELPTQESKNEEQYKPKVSRSNENERSQ